MSPTKTSLQLKSVLWSFGGKVVPTREAIDVTNWWQPAAADSLGVPTVLIAHY